MRRCSSGPLPSPLLLLHQSCCSQDCAHQKEKRSNREAQGSVGCSECLWGGKCSRAASCGGDMGVHSAKGGGRKIQNYGEQHKNRQGSEALGCREQSKDVKSTRRALVSFSFFSFCALTPAPHAHTHTRTCTQPNEHRTHSSFSSVPLLFSASAIAAAPSSPMPLPSRLCKPQRGEHETGRRVGGLL